MEKVTAPGPSWFQSVLTLPRFRRQPLEVLTEWRRRHGDIVRIGAGPRTFHLLSAPEHVRWVLQKNATNYGKQMIGYKKLRLILGDGLLTSEGRNWLRRRRLAQPAFHRTRLQKFGQQMTEATKQMLDRWTGRDSVDVAQEMMRLTYRIVGATLLSAETNKDEELTIGEEVGEVMGYVADRAIRILDWPESIPTPTTLRFRRAVRHFDELVYEALKERRKATDPPDDLLTMLMKASDPETGEGLTDLELRDEVVTIMGAGHETTANALSWTFFLLATHPEVESRFQDELARTLEGRTPTVSDLEGLKYTGQVFKEAMRLYPPVWLIARSVKKEDMIDGRTIPKGSSVLLSPYVTHRHPRIWHKPERFDPDRFQTNDRFEGAYFPFGGGARRCIGEGFAMMEAKLILAMIGQRYRLRLLGPKPVPEVTVTLRPRGGLPMSLEET